jgi:biopolymer transport protein ExbB
MLETLVKGGPVMIPIALSSVLALAVLLERMWYFWRTRVNTEHVVESLRPPLSEGKYLEALQVARQYPASVAGVLSAGIAYADRGVDEMRMHLDLAGRDEVQRMEKGLPILGTVTTIAPLLGLLGTVTGIIRSFRVLSAMQGIEGPSALSAGIAEALITTAAGLSIAIPAAVAFEWCSSVIDQRIQEINRMSNQIVDIVAETRGEAQ